MHIRNLCILGGTGFVGQHIVTRLGIYNEQELRVHVPSRNPERHKHLIVVPNLYLHPADVHSEQELVQLVEGCEAVINLVGILNEHRPGDFRRVHVELPEKLVNACRKAGVQRLLHMSALGASDDAPSEYQRTKAEGERIALQANSETLAVSSFRPSVIFGPEDSFFNRFAHLLKMAPGIFPLPTPEARFAPVYVADVAEAFLRCLTNHATFGRSYEFCGPRIYTLRQLVEYTAELTELRRNVIGVGDGLSRLQARILETLPGKPYSRDNYLSATVDNVCSRNGLAELGIKPTAIEAVVPNYLARTRAVRRFRLQQKAHRHLEQ